MNETLHLVSIGKLAELLQAPVTHVQAFLDGIGAKPHLTLNWVAYYSFPDCGEVVRRFESHTKQGAKS